jgi:hypothetical protein
MTNKLLTENLFHINCQMLPWLALMVLQVVTSEIVSIKAKSLFLFTQPLKIIIYVYIFKFFLNENIILKH